MVAISWYISKKMNVVWTPPIYEAILEIFHWITYNKNINIFWPILHFLHWFYKATQNTQRCVHPSNQSTTMWNVCTYYIKLQKVSRFHRSLSFLLLHWGAKGWRKGGTHLWENSYFLQRSSDQVEISLPGCWNDQLRPPSWKYLKYYLPFCGNIIKGKMIKMLWWKIWQCYRNVKTNRRLNKIVRPLVWEGASNCTGYQISHSTSPSRWPATEEWNFDKLQQNKVILCFQNISCCWFTSTFMKM